jgi:hypothetical protein
VEYEARHVQGLRLDIIAMAPACEPIGPPVSVKAAHKLASCHVLEPLRKVVASSIANSQRLVDEAA